MRILVLNTDYPLFQAQFYGDNPALAASSYEVQMAARNDSLFGVADFYSRGFQRLGHQAAEVHANNDVMQKCWAREHGMNVLAAEALAAPVAPSGLRRTIQAVLGPVLRPVLRRVRPGGMTREQADILRAQIEDFAPDIILNQEMDFIRSGFLSGVRKRGRFIVGQIAAALPVADNFRAYDLVITSLPNFVQWFRARGVHAELNRLAFDPVILEKMGPQPRRDIDVSFVGSLSPEHADRIALLEKIAAATPLKIWGNGIERLPASSPLHKIYQGPAWGRGMYDVLRRSRITLNYHINLAGRFANNMRLYEATGSGALLLTDMKDNLAEIFAPGREVAAYSDADDCVARIRHFLAHEDERAQIAAAGQGRTLREHNYAMRTAQIMDLVASLPLRSAA